MKTIQCWRFEVRDPEGVILVLGTADQSVAREILEHDALGVIVTGCRLWHADRQAWDALQASSELIMILDAEET